MVFAGLAVSFQRKFTSWEITQPLIFAVYAILAVFTALTFTDHLPKRLHSN